MSRLERNLRNGTSYRTICMFFTASKSEEYFGSGCDICNYFAFKTKMAVWPSRVKKEYRKLYLCLYGNGSEAFKTHYQVSLSLFDYLLSLFEHNLSLSVNGHGPVSLPQR